MSRGLRGEPRRERGAERRGVSEERSDGTKTQHAHYDFSPFLSSIQNHRPLEIVDPNSIITHLLFQTTNTRVDINQIK